MSDVKRKKDKKGSTFFTGFFLFIFFGLLFLFLFLDNNSIVTWNESDLDKILLEEQIKNAVVRYKENNITSVSGIAIDKKGREYNFTVNIDAHRFNKGFVTMDGQKHGSYYSYFLNAINKTKKNLLTTKNKEDFFLKVGQKNDNEITLSKILISTLLILIRLFLDIFMYVAIFLLFFSMMKKKGFFANEKMTGFWKEIKSGNKNFLTFNDIAGYESVKNEVKSIIAYLKNPQKFISSGAVMPRGILLFGPPGVGKTLLAKAVAGEAGVPFFFIACTEFFDEFVSFSSKKVREIFKIASKNAPSIIFIDEIDMAGKKDNLHSHNEVINQLLVEMDSFKQNDGVVVFAATNRKDMIDESLLRSGRFDKHIEMFLPNRKEREAIFRRVSKNKNISHDVDFSYFARITMGLSGADIFNIMNEAVMISILQGKNEINSDIINESIEKKLIGLSTSSAVPNDKNRKIAAVHEIGHALVAMKVGFNVDKITILNRGISGGHTVINLLDENDYFHETQEQYINEISYMLGGRAAEEIFLSKIIGSSMSDIERATQTAYFMVRNLGMSSSLTPIRYVPREIFSRGQFVFSSENTNFEIDNEVKKIIAVGYDNAKKIILKNKKLFKKLLDAILACDVLYDNDIKKIINENNENKKKINKKDKGDANKVSTELENK